MEGAGEREQTVLWGLLHQHWRNKRSGKGEINSYRLWIGNDETKDPQDAKWSWFYE